MASIQTGRFADSWRPLIHFRCKCVLKKDNEWKAELGGIYRPLERLERIQGRFPSADPSGRFAGVPSLGKPYIEKEYRLQYNP